MKEQVRTASGNSVGVGRSSRAVLRLAGTKPRPTEAAPEDAPHAESLGRLAKLLAAHAPYDGAFTLRVPGLHVVRRSKPYPEMVRATVTPALCIVAQGAKIVMLGREVYSYDASRMIAYAVDLPIAGQIVRASRSEPFLALKLDLDPYRVAELALKVYPHGVPNPQDNRGVFVGQATAAIVDAATRLVELMAQPAEAELLAPLVVDEVLIRLLRSAIGPRIAQIGRRESGFQRVANAITWVRANFTQPLAVEALADLAHMSPSSFHHHFKAVTSMSPLQYQKVLRLHEARRLMLSRMMDAGIAGREVGYLSASQFSREYTRLFGSAPTRDVARLRQNGVAAAVPRHRTTAMKVMLPILPSCLLMMSVVSAHAQAGSSMMGGDTVARPTQPVHLDTRSALRELLRHPAFAGFAHLILPWDDRAYDERMPLSRIGSLLPYHTHVDPETVASGLNRMIDDAASRKTVFYRFYSDADAQQQPAKSKTGLFFFRGRPGAPFAVIAPGGGFSYVASVHEGFPYAAAISSKGYNAFVLKYRVGQGGAVATQDLAAAVSYIIANAAALGVSPTSYSLWGSSAGARMAASIGSHGAADYGGGNAPKPSTVVMAYTGHSDYASVEPPTFVVVGEEDGIAPAATMKRRVEALRKSGTNVEYREYRGLGHGFGLGVGTAAEGWVFDAIRFWETSLRSGYPTPATGP